MLSLTLKAKSSHPKWLTEEKIRSLRSLVWDNPSKAPKAPDNRIPKNKKSHDQ